MKLKYPHFLALFSPKKTPPAAHCGRSEPPQVVRYPTTNFTMGYFFNPKIQWLGNDKLAKMPDMKSDLSFRAGIEVPLYRYLSAGGYVGYATYSFPSQDKGGLITIGTGLDLKTQIPIEFGKQRIAPYLVGSLGVAGMIDNNTLSERSALTEGDISSRSVEFGFGPTGQLMAGLEYYPVPLVGIFIEGGMQALLGLHRVEKATRTTQSSGNEGSMTSSSTETTWGFNTYLLNAWQLQFGLKLGF